MKFKSLALLIGIFSLSSCGAFDDFTYSGIFDDQEAIGKDALFSDTTFESIPTHDHIDCAGSCTVKTFNK
jgi:hypothetical protein